MIHEDAVEDRKCGDTEPLCACTDGRGYGSGISKTLQGAGCRPDLYGNGPVSYTHLDVYKRQQENCGSSLKAGKSTQKPRPVW